MAASCYLCHLCEVEKMLKKMDALFCTDLLRYSRRVTEVVNIGGLPLGGDDPVRIQSMTNTDTSDVIATVRQIIKIAKEGADYVRLTAPGKKEAEALGDILVELLKRSCSVPIIADIHFNPNVALMAAEVVDKVRINPGNFVDKKQFKQIEYTDKSYQKELLDLREEFLKLLKVCHDNNTALRIGTNHGSLSDRIMSHYGDTPEGMVESAMEFLRICKEVNFHQVVISMKASNTRIMVYATRLLVKKMKEEGLNYPLHLGVTEAGEGEDGRIKSATGIGALLADGIGETVRVSLTEDPELEVPVARKLVDYVKQREGHAAILPFGDIPIDFYAYKKRPTFSLLNMGCEYVPVVLYAMIKPDRESLKAIGWNYNNATGWNFSDLSPDYLVISSWPSDLPAPKGKGIIKKYDQSVENINGLETGTYVVLDNTSAKIPLDFQVCFLEIKASDLTGDQIDQIRQHKNVIIVLDTDNTNGYADQRAAIFRLMNAQCQHPVILKRHYSENFKEDFQLKAAADLGGLFIDGLGDGIFLDNQGDVQNRDIAATAFGILQASRVRISKTEFISCPSCGRTLFDLQSTTRMIRERTAHLKGLKIGIMGCIVNGPGEMADADYGYVGTGRGRVTLYKQKDVVVRNVPEEKAVEELIELIKKNGDWVEP